MNNAATLVFADAVFQTEDMFRRQFDVNVIGAWALSKVCMTQFTRLFFHYFVEELEEFRAEKMLEFFSSLSLFSLEFFGDH